MIVYAIFLCVQAAPCRLLEQPYVDSFGYQHQTTVYRTLSECQQGIHRYGAITEGSHGRFLIGPGMWYECRHRHIDTWSKD